MKVLYGVTEVPSTNAGKKKGTKSVDMPKKLFDEIAPKYVNRNGGYTRILKMGYRVGDNAPMAYVELVQKTTDNKPAAEAKEEAKAE